MTFTTLHPEHYAITDYTVIAPEQLKLTEHVGQLLLSYASSLLLKTIGHDNDIALPDLPDVSAAPIHVRFRHNGAYWSEGFSMSSSLTTGLDEAVTRAIALRKAARNLEPLLSPSDLADNLGVELTLFYKAENLGCKDLDSLHEMLPSALYGVGLEVNGHFALLPNSNWFLCKGSLSTLLKHLSISTGHSGLAYLDEANNLWRFNTVSWVRHKPDTPVQPLYRCDSPVSIEAVTHKSLEKFADRVGQCLIKWVQHDGHLEYRFDPIKGNWGNDNNILRQWMATHALAELYHWSGKEEYSEAWRINAEYNLGKSYHEKGDYGYILHQQKAKLGAAACATMAMHHGPHDGEYSTVTEKLRQGLWHQRQQSGLFRTFFIPATRNDQHSFYSGEALLAMAMGLAEDKEKAKRVELIRQSKAAYLEYFIDSGRYAPFIPWHTMAYWHMYDISGEEHYLDSIFELNDYLLCLQDLEDNTDEIDKGRFYKEETAFHGVEHSSSTAIYVEGLCYAYKSALTRGDETRRQAYLNAIRWGLRSLMQLEITERNSFYFYHKEYALGGIKTTPANPTVRCDNIQHTVMAILSALKFIPNNAWQTDLPQAKPFLEKQLLNYQKLSEPVTRDNNELSIMLTGDAQLSRYTELWCETRGLEHPFKRIQKELQNTDLLACNLECVVATSGKKVKKTGRKVYHFRASPQMLSIFPDKPPVYASLANNHTMDYGEEALMEMIKHHLPAKGIAFSGAGKNLNEASAAKVMSIKGVTMAFSSFTSIEPQFGAGPDKAGYNYIDLRDEAQIKQTLKQAVDKSNSDLNIVSMHWGKNHDHEITDLEQRFAHIAIDAGMDAVVGHHSHLTRGIEIYRGTPIFYDLGNFVVDFKFFDWDDRSILAKLIIRDKKIYRVELIPVSVRDKTVTPLTGQESEAILERLAQLSAPFKLPLLMLNNKVVISMQEEVHA